MSLGAQPDRSPTVAAQLLAGVLLVVILALGVHVNFRTRAAAGYARARDSDIHHRTTAGAAAAEAPGRKTTAPSTKALYPSYALVVGGSIGDVLPRLVV